MTLYEFTVLTPQQQLDAVWQHGQFLASRHQGNRQANLYTMGVFFIEVFYDPTHNEIIRYRAFVTDKLLLPYIPDQLLAQLMAD